MRDATSNSYSTHTILRNSLRKRDKISISPLRKIPLKIEVCIPTGSLIHRSWGRKSWQRSSFGGAFFLVLMVRPGRLIPSIPGNHPQKFRTVSLILLQFNFPSPKTPKTFQLRNSAKMDSLPLNGTETEREGEVF